MTNDLFHKVLLTQLRDSDLVSLAVACAAAAGGTLPED